MLTIKNYVLASSLEEAWQLNQKKSSQVIGGMLWLKMQNLDIQTAIDLSALGLDTIEETEEEFVIGSMVTLRQLEQHEAFLAYTNGAVSEALRHIVGVQFRNLATVGGSIFGRYGFSDVLTLLLSLDTQVELYHAGLMPLADFAKTKYDRDILVRIHVKKHSGKGAYLCVRNSQTDFPVLTCAARITDGTVQLVYGARPGKAVILDAPKELLTAPYTEEKRQTLADYAAAHIPTGTNMRGSAAYRSHLVGVLTNRILQKLED